MTYDELTDTQRKSIDDFMANARPLAGQLSKTLSLMEAVTLDYATGVSDILSLLDPQSSIPNKTGLAGAKPVGTEQVSDMTIDFLAILAAHYQTTDKAFFVMMAGAVNSVV